MKVLYILSNTNADGSTFSFITLLKYMISKGYETVVIVPNSNVEFVDYLKSLGAKSYVVKIAFSSWPRIKGIVGLLKYPVSFVRFIRRSLIMRREISSIVSRERPQLIHTNVSVIDVGHRVAKEFSIPHIWHIREYGDKDFDFHYFPSKRLYRKKLYEDYTICITKGLQLYHGLNENAHSYVVYNGVRSSAECFSYCEKDPYFLCASRVSEEKGQLMVIKVFARFHKFHPEYKLRIVGAGEELYMNKCRELAMEYECENSVIFDGYQKNVDEYFKKAKALLVASPFEGFGRMSAEAAFYGCMLIGRNNAGTKEIIESIGGLLWDDEDEFLDKMEVVVGMNPECYKNNVIESRNKAVLLYSSESYSENVEKIYVNATVN